MILGDSGLNRVSTMVASDGELADNRFYETPAGNSNYGYLDLAGYEMLKGNLYIFGGRVSATRISILVDCEIKPLSATLQYGFQSGGGAIATLPGIKNEGMIRLRQQTKFLKFFFASTQARTQNAKNSMAKAPNKIRR
jgi:hypothetical protein